MILGLLGFACIIVAFVGYIMILIAAFRESAMWGLGVLFIPLVVLIYAIMFWEDAKRGFLLYVGGVGGVFLVGVLAAMAIPAMVQPSDFEELESWEQAEGGDWDEWDDDASETTEVRPTRIPPTPAPTQTPYISRLLPTSTPSSERFVAPRPTVFVLSTQTAGERIGWLMEVVTTDGREFQGTLIGVNDELLQFEQHVGGGSVIFPVRKDEVATLRALN